MKVTDLPNLSKGQYGRADALKRELVEFATYAERFGRGDLTAWLLEAHGVIDAIMPAASE